MQELILLPEEESIGERADKYRQFFRSIQGASFRNFSRTIRYRFRTRRSRRVTALPEKKKSLTIPDAQKPDIVPENIPLDILYEDQDLLW